MNWDPIEKLDLKRFKDLKKQSFHNDTHPPFVKQVLNSCATWNRISPQDLKDLVTAILEAVPKLQWQTW